MQHKILSLLFPGLMFAANAQAVEIYHQDANKLDFYGKAAARYDFSKNAGDRGDGSYARLGFTGETKLAEGLIGYGRWENNFPLNNSEGSDAQKGVTIRLGYAGIKSTEFGSLDYGRNFALIYDALGFTDVLPLYGGDSIGTDTITGRISGAMTYRNTDFFGLMKGLNFGLQIQNKNDRKDILRANGVGWAVSSSYTSTLGLGLVGAYQEHNRTHAQQAGYYGQGRGSKARIWALGIKYDSPPFYLATIYFRGNNAAAISHNVDGESRIGFANRTQGIEAVAQYQFDSGLRPSIAFIQSRASEVRNIGDVDLAKYIDLGTSYALNDNFSLYVDYNLIYLPRTINWHSRMRIRWV